MTNPSEELTGYEEHLRDEATADDYRREAYGDACPGCGTLRFGGDCACHADFDEQDDAAYEATLAAKAVRS